MAENFNNFQLKYKGIINKKIQVKKYRSVNTGIHVVLANIDGPMLKGYFCLATEPENDDGLPHVLEHVVFLGSDEYPYKGVLDSIATISLSEGTNAWTDTDHTCFTISTAGAVGFLQLLPIYLDHILYPKLTDSAFLTEVHHITGEGKDAGVVYSEMQAEENTGSNKVFLEVLRNIYPEDSGYRFEKGGILKNIRNSTNNEKVREFHRRFYIPQNLCLIITGTIDHQQLFTVLSEFEKKIIDKGALYPNFTRPWATNIATLDSSMLKTIDFPSDDSDEGIVAVAWRGPKISNQVHLMALTVLLEYFTESPVALLNQEFVEVSTPLCGEVSYTIVENSETIFCIEFESAQIKSIEKIPQKLFKLLNDLGDKKIMMDMERLKIVVNNRLVDVTNELEDDPHETVAAIMIGDFLYGTDKSDLNERLRQVDILKSLQKYSDIHWIEFMKWYMIRGHNVTIIGKPSPKEVKKLAKEDEMRIENRKRKLGRKGLDEKKKMLINAINENNKSPPKDFFSRFSIPSTHSLQYHTIKSYHNCQQFVSIKADYSIADLAKIPCCFQLDDIKNEFVSINLCIDLQRLPSHLMPYLPVYVEVLFESPIIRNGVEIPYENVINELQKDTMEFSSSVGIGGTRFTPGEFSTTIIIGIKVERSKFEAGVKWCGELITGIRFTPDRIKAVAKKLLSDIKQQRTDAEDVVEAISVMNIYEKDSIPNVSSLLIQQHVLKYLAASAKSDIIYFEELQRHLMTLENIYINMATDVEKLNADLKGKSLSDIWNTNFIHMFKGTPTTNHEMSWKLRGNIAIVVDPGTIKSAIVGLGSTDTAYLIQVARSFCGFDHPDVPAMRVFCHFVSFLEGPMWKLIRGKGLAYSFSLDPEFGEGLLYFRIGQSGHIYDAYEQALGLLKSVIDGRTVISDLELECAKCECIYELIQSVETPIMASNEAFSSFMKDIPLDYYSDMIHKVQGVTKEQVIRIGKDYIKNLLTTEGSTIFIACKAKELATVATKFSTLCHRKFDIHKNFDDIELK